MRNRNAGFTLIEILLTTAFLAIVIFSALLFTRDMVGASEDQMCQVSLETQSNLAMTEIVRHIRESNGGKTLLQAYTLGSSNYTAVLLPNPRNKDGQFVVADEDEYGDPVYTGVPFWQGYIMLYVNEDKELVAYFDYRCEWEVGTPSIPYPEDFGDTDPEAWHSLIYANKGTEYELHKDKYIAAQDLNVSVKVIARDVTTFLVTQTTTGLRVYVVFSKDRGPRSVRVAYQEELRLRNSN